jgi:exodeoxyribonuclease V alpha subunit
LAGIEKYLASGMVKGIGPHFAKQLVSTFGKEVFDVIENASERLTELPGIGSKRKAKLLAGWRSQKAIRSIMVFLQGHGVSSARAVRIYKTYGDQAISKVQENPYCLALDIYGIGFTTADAIASQLGIATDSLRRACAGLRHIMQAFSQEGHCTVLQSDLLAKTSALLGIPEARVLEALEEEVMAEHLIRQVVDAQPAIALASLHYAEISVAASLKRLLKGTPPWGKVNAKQANEAISKLSQTLSVSQQTAVVEALQSKVFIISGGPGVGKTTVVCAFLSILNDKHLSYALCAPTGRAAKRLSETTGFPAKTIHRLLEFEPRRFAFKYHQDNPLSVDLVIVDEASMLDVVLMQQLLKAIPSHAALLIIGDRDQLPSVGPGSVLSDILASQCVPTAYLTEIFRQAATSQIIINAHRVNQGQLPVLSTSSTLTDFYFVQADSPEEIQTKILLLVAERIPRRFNLHPVRDIQVLAPMNRGSIGAQALNGALQNKLNGQATPKITRFGWTFSQGDKVIQLFNNYDKEVFNGDIGHVAAVDLDEEILRISFDGRLVDYEWNELDELALAYAMSIHKSQGCEYPAVVIPIAMQHYRLLARNLLYTAITRGKKLVVLVGQRRALAIAVQNAHQNLRLTQLEHHLKGY